MPRRNIYYPALQLLPRPEQVMALSTILALSSQQHPITEAGALEAREVPITGTCTFRVARGTGMRVD